MKKTGIIVMVLILATMMMFTGCQRQQRTAEAPNTITVWCWDPAFNIYAMNVASEIYRRDNPNVTINIVEVGWDDIQTRLTTAFTANQTASLPDIILIQDNAIQMNVQNYPTRFLPVDGKVDLSQFAQFKLDVGFINGRNYGVPFDNGATGFFIRRDIVERAGLQVSDFNDITWERFIELGSQVRQRTGLPMISADPSSPDLIMVMLHSAGSWFFDAQGNANIRNNAVLRRSIEILIEGYQTGVIMDVNSWDAYISSFNNGTVAGTIQGAWIIGSVTQAADQAGLWSLVSVPRFGNIPNATNYSSAGGSGWAVLANSRNPDLAMDFLNKTFAGSVELYNTILPSAGAIATWGPAARAPAYSEPHAFFGGQRVFEDLVRYAENVPRVKFGIFNYEGRQAVGRQLVDIAAGRQSIDGAIEAAAREVDFALANQ